MKRKRLILIGSIIVLTIIIISLSIFIVFSPKYFSKNNDPEVLRKLDATYKDIKKEELPIYIKERFALIENGSLTDEEKYDQLDTLKMFIASTYNETHNSEFRNIINTDLKEYANNSISDASIKSQIEEDFYQICADSGCNNNPLDAEYKLVVEEIRNSKTIPKEEIETILYNLELAILISPEDDLFSKQYGLELAIYQLYGLGIPEASMSADKLDALFVKTYNQHPFSLE